MKKEAFLIDSGGPIGALIKGKAADTKSMLMKEFELWSALLSKKTPKMKCL